MPEARSVGITLRAGRRDLEVEPFFHAIVAGLDDRLMPRGFNVVRELVRDPEEERSCYERWARSGLVAGVVVTNLTPSDSRPALLNELGLPGVVLGEPDDDPGIAVVRSDGRAAMVQAVRRLAELGHRRIGHVSGPPALLHTQSRIRGFDEEAERLGVGGLRIGSDYSARGGADAAEALMREPAPPSAIVFDNDMMAVAALARIEAMGLSVPRDVSLLAWDDSLPCRLARPPLSAMSHDVHRIGELAAIALLEILDGGPILDLAAPPPLFLARGSTAPPR